MTDRRVVGLLAAVAGAVFVVALLLPWWSPPGDLLDPPDDLPDAVEFLAQGYADDVPGMGPERWDAYEYFDLRDALWLVTGIVGFAFGLAVLAGFRFARPLAFVAGGLALVSAGFIAEALIWPPDYDEATAEFFEDAGFEEQPQPLGYALPFSREYGGYLALAAACGVAAAAALSLLGGRREPA